MPTSRGDDRARDRTLSRCISVTSRRNQSWSALLSRLVSHLVQNVDSILRAEHESHHTATIAETGRDGSRFPSLTFLPVSATIELALTLMYCIHQFTPVTTTRAVNLRLKVYMNMFSLLVLLHLGRSHLARSPFLSRRLH